MLSYPLFFKTVSYKPITIQWRWVNSIVRCDKKTSWKKAAYRQTSVYENISCRWTLELVITTFIIVAQTIVIIITATQDHTARVSLFGDQSTWHEIILYEMGPILAYKFGACIEVFSKQKCARLVFILATICLIVLTTFSSDLVVLYTRSPI